MTVLSRGYRRRASAGAWSARHSDNITRFMRGCGAPGNIAMNTGE
jgi:hypothetical protein